jgi:mannose-1-phosphate guanylyltransferase/mannose-6-phosphate isomerase
MTTQILPIVLSGGAGTRLWPESRQRQPKQLLPLADERSMFLTTIQRAAALPGAIAPVVVSNEGHRSGIRRDLASAGYPDARMLLEPIGRNTAPAVAAAALDRTKTGEDPLLLVLPADHVITDEEALAAAVGIAVTLADDGYLVTFGITPTHPETGYGYIETGEGLNAGGMDVASFREKPDAETAAAYVADGRHLWNSGMFLFRAKRFLEELEKYQPAVLGAAREALNAGKEEDGAVTLDRKAMARSPSISIDYAVMEPTDRGAVVPLDAGWSDVGSWEALWELAEADEAGNVVAGDVEILGVTNSYIRAREDRLIAAIGLDNIAIVDTPDATLIAARERVQDVKEIVARLTEQHRAEVESHVTESRAWGGFATLFDGPSFRVIRLWVEPGAKTLVKTHPNHSEYWIVVRGVATIQVGATTSIVHEEDSMYIPAGEAHRLENASPDRMLEVIEVRVTGSGRDDAGGTR